MHGFPAHGCCRLDGRRKIKEAVACTRTWFVSSRPTVSSDPGVSTTRLEGRQNEVEEEAITVVRPPVSTSPKSAGVYFSINNLCQERAKHGLL